MRRNRTETELIAAVLVCCETPKRILAIIQEVNISHSRLLPLMEHLGAQGLIQKETHSETSYQTTRKGMAFIAEYRRFKDLCNAYAIRP